MKTSEKLRKKLEEMGFFPVENPKCLHTGRWQKSTGAWSWHCRDKNGWEISSAYTMQDCLKSKDIQVYEREGDFSYELCVMDYEPKAKKEKKWIIKDNTELNNKVQKFIKKYYGLE